MPIYRIPLRLSGVATGAAVEWRIVGNVHRASAAERHDRAPAHIERGNVIPSIEDLRRAAELCCTPSVSLRQQLSITLETLQIIREELRLAREALAAQQLPDRGETVWHEWCAAWHDADPRLTARRERQLTRHVVDHLWGAIDRGVSPELRGDMMMTAATLAIRAHWPA